MKRHELEALAKKYRAGKVPLAEFVQQVTASDDSPSAKKTDVVTLDDQREARCGFPEVVYGEGKSPEVIAQIFERQLKRNITPLATRIDAEQGAWLSKRYPEALYSELGRTFRFPHSAKNASWGRVGLVTAGTSDLPVSEEAKQTLLWMGIEPTAIHDVGVAGPHRFGERVAEIQDADAVIVIAGMEGALPSVVGGYLSCPVIAVPTSVGYGASFQGIAALLGMLNSCASNVTVVNIDAGFKGAYLAGLIAQRVQKAETRGT